MQCRSRKERRRIHMATEEGMASNKLFLTRWMSLSLITRVDPLTLMAIISSQGAMGSRVHPIPNTCHKECNQDTNRSWTVPRRCSVLYRYLTTWLQAPNRLREVYRILRCCQVHQWYNLHLIVDLTKDLRLVKGPTPVNSIWLERTYTTTRNNHSYNRADSLVNNSQTDWN
jgi:hypothetical protein